MSMPRRKLHRLQCWDYSENGYYFVTICTQGKRKLFGHVEQSGLDAIMIPNELGKIALQNWNRMPDVCEYVKLDVFCLMPNHFHGIIVIDKPQNAICPSVSQLVRGFKSTVTRQYNSLVPPSEKNMLWQSSFYDEISKSDRMLDNQRNYIIGNPSKWLEDPLYIE